MKNINKKANTLEKTNVQNLSKAKEIQMKHLNNEDMKENRRSSDSILLIKYKKNNYISDNISTFYLDSVSTQTIDLVQLINEYRYIVVDEDQMMILLLLIYHEHLYIYSKFQFYSCAEYVKKKIIDDTLPLNNFHARIFMLMYIFIYLIVKADTKIVVTRIYDIVQTIDVEFIKSRVKNKEFWFPATELLNYYNPKEHSFILKKTENYEDIMKNKLLNFRSFNMAERHNFNNIDSFIYTLQHLQSNPLMLKYE